MSDHAKIFIVDDDAGVRDALTMLLEAAGYTVEAFQCAAEFLDNYTPRAQCCLILDVHMPDMDGPTLQEELIRRGLRLPVIFLSGHGTIPITVRTIKAGAMDFLTKPVDGSVLLAHVKKALEQGMLLKKQIDSHQSASSRLETLTAREREVLMLAISGHASKEIAQHLGISFRTVEIHRAHVLQKTGASNLLELARIPGMLESLQLPD
jgi:FixJ family two-component response regulator